MSDLIVLSHPDCARHEMGPGHPERPQRLAAIDAALDAAGLPLRRIEAPPATRAELERVHERRYLDAIYAGAPRDGRYVELDPDTRMNRYTLAAAERAAGAAVAAVDLVLGGDARHAFGNVRPPGHHAERRRAMGFCLFDNVAVGAAHALAAHGLERVAIIDFDVHHGNGTEDIFGADPRVLFCSSFQHPFYPGSGADTVSAHVLNVPLPAGTDSATWRRAVEARWFEPLARFRPQLVLYSAGFDAHADDPLAELLLTEADYAWVTAEIGAIAAVGTVSMLEGGYDLAALGRSAVAHLGALARL